MADATTAIAGLTERRNVKARDETLAIGTAVIWYNDQNLRLVR